MARIFKNVAPTKLKRNVFNLSHDVKLSTEFGRLTPILCKEVVPGDTFRLRSEMLIRTAPLYAPLMHKVNAYVHYFYVPSRLLMDNWDTFITGGKNGDGRKETREGSMLVAKPYANLNRLLTWFPKEEDRRHVFGECSLFDYLGFPAFTNDELNAIQTGSSSNYSDQPIDLMPFKAYNLIWNEYYRDENFEEEIDICTDQDDQLTDFLEGISDVSKRNAIMTGLFNLKQRNWEKDYFTSALPFPQRGLDTTVGVGYDAGSLSAEVTGDGFVNVSSNRVDVNSIAQNLGVEITGGNEAVSINELRRAIAIQKFKERSARYGYRLTEFLRGFFGVTPDDARLQRPEFLGGFKQQVQFGEVLQTSETSADSPQGGYAGTGFSLSGGKYIKRYFKEHGYIIGILSIMPKPAYMQGWPREFDRFDRLDYYLPDFAHLGEQEIKRKELNFVPTLMTNGANASTNNVLFGYTPRYAEYKFALSRVCGNMRSTLDFWHLARRVKEGQSLNGSFLLLDNQEMDRVFNAVTSEVDGQSIDHFWLQVYHDIKAVRPMPKFGTPLI